MRNGYIIVCNAGQNEKSGRFWLGRNPLNNYGYWIFECFVTKPMKDWEPVIWKTREAAEKVLKRVRRPGAYILSLEA